MAVFGEAEGEKKRTNLSLRQNVYSDYLNQVPKQVFDEMLDIVLPNI